MAMNEVVKRLRYVFTSEGADKVVADQQKVNQETVKSSQQSERASLSQARAFENLERRYNPVIKAQQDYEKVQQRVNAAVAQNPALQDRANDVLKRAGEYYNMAGSNVVNFTSKAGLARHELVNLSRQAQDIGVSLASGQSPFTVLIQQGTQVADVFASSQGTIGGFWSQLKTGAAAVFTPLRLVGGAVASLGIAAVTAAVQYSGAQRDIERSLLGIGRASGATSETINRIATSSSSAFGLSTSEAAEFATQLAATGRIGVDEIGKITAIGKDVARVFGVDAADAAKLLAKAYADPVQGAEELNQRLGTFDAATQRNIQSLVAQNRIFEAQAVITQKVQQGVEGVNQTVGTGTNLWTALGNSISGAWRLFGQDVSRLVGLEPPRFLETLKDDIAASERRVASLQDRLRNMSPASSRGQPGQAAAAELAEEQSKVIGLTRQYEMLTKAIQDGNDARRQSVESQAKRATVVRTSPEISEFNRVRDNAEATARLLDEVRKSGGEASPLLRSMGLSMEEVAQAAARAQGALATMLTPAQRMTAQFEAQMSAITARTAAERVGAAEQQRSLDLAGQNLSEEERAVAIRQAGALVQAQINQQHADAMQSLQGQLSVAQAVGAEAKLQAQEQANIVDLIRQGYTEEQARAQAAQQTAATYAQIQSSAQMQLQAAQDQTAVAQAQNGADRMRAQNQATYNQLRRQGVEEGTAAANADEQQAAAQAQINNQVREQTIGIQQNTEMIYAQITGQEASVAAAQAYENAIRAGADETEAAAQSQAVLANYAAKAAQEEERFAQAALKAAEAADRADQQRAEQENAKAFGKGGVISGGLWGQYLRNITDVIKSLNDSVGNTGHAYDSVYGSGNYAQGSVKVQTGLNTFMDIPLTVVGPGAKDYQQGLSSDYLHQQVAKDLVAGANPSDIANQLLNGGYRRPNALYDAGAAAPLEIFKTLLDLDKRAGVSPEDTLAKIKSGQYGQGVDYTDLLSAMDELTSAIDSNTDAQRDVLSSLYTTDPRLSRLGFRTGSSALNYDPFSAQPQAPDVFGNDGASVSTGGMAQVGISGTASRLGNINTFAAGGIMTEDGIVPLRNYAGGGIAYGPQAAVYGEGATPEAFVPVPSGQIPVQIRGGARPITVNQTITIQGNADERAMQQLKQSPFQIRQQLQRTLTW